MKKPIVIGIIIVVAALALIGYFASKKITQKIGEKVIEKTIELKSI
jgi:septation ring formation regulator EzrA